MTLPRFITIPLLAIPWLLAIAGFGWLAYLRFPPSGIFVAETTLGDRSPWIFPFLPAERVSSPGLQPDGWTGQRITADPAYFTARIPGPYERAVVTLDYRPVRQPLLEFGIVRDAAGKELDLSPLYSSELESPEWGATAFESQSGFVRNGIPATRLADENPRGLSIWYASGTMPHFEDAAKPATLTDVSLRGSHDFYFVPAGGAVSATFRFQDANRASGSDAVVFRVFRGDEELHDLTFAQQATNERRMGEIQTHAVNIPNAGSGVYRISFSASDDVFLRSIETTSARWVVGPRLYFGDTVGLTATNPPGYVWTTSRHLVAQTFHAEGVQTVSFGQATGKISRTHETVRMDRNDADTRPIVLNAPRGDVKFELDGFAAFRPEAFFEPKPRRLTDATKLLEEGIEAVRTPYRAPTDLGDGWRSSTFTYQIPSNADTLRFVLSAPGLAARVGSVDVRRVRIEFGRPAGTWREWLKTLRQELVNAWHRL